MTSRPRPRSARRGPLGGRGARFVGGALLAAALASGCAGLSFTRETENTGTFVSTGTAFTIFSIDLPRSALDIARENASDAGVGKLEVEHVWVFPYLGPFDWLLDILSVRYARITGTWGYEE